MSWMDWLILFLGNHQQQVWVFWVFSRRLTLVLNGLINFQLSSRVQGHLDLRLKLLSERRTQRSARQYLDGWLPLEELQRMEKLGVISCVEGPTDWCSLCVVIPKKNGKIRVCIDYTKLKEQVKRKCHPLPTTEQTLGMLGNASYFSKLDANSGYWQIEIQEDCRHLTTSITPFGRFLCNRLLFGISSASEIFQWEMHMVLEELPEQSVKWTIFLCLEITKVNMINGFV